MTIKSNTPDRLYHYTDQNGLIGILDSKSMRATHLFYQNDASEFKHGEEVFYRVIETVKARNNATSNGDIVADIKSRIATYNNPVFTTSFSESEKSLNQYRGYSKSKPGFSIGFDIEKIKSHAESLNFQCKIAKCLYNDREQEDFAEKMIAEHIPHDSEISQDAINRIAAIISTYSSVMKHESFHEEKEWRLIYDCLNPVRKFYHIRAGESFLIPFLAVPIITNEVIKSITIGPTPHPDLAYISTKELLSKHGIFNGKLNECIRKSNLPYRNW